MPVHTKRASGLGAHGGGEGGRGATWVFEAEAFDVTKKLDLVPTDESVYASSTPVAGVLNPETKTPDPNGRYFYFASVPIWRTKPNTVFRYLTNGGGGWGSRLERDPERVKRDVRDGYVTIEGARRDYGVLVTGDPEHDPEGLQVDLEASRKLREEMATR
jgi:N-methylhydantoinase B